MRHSRLYARTSRRGARPNPGARLRRIIHRGPNQQGVFESEAVSLGAARLKIIDLEGGDQPIISEDGDTVIVFNGEIYNHLELRARTGTARPSLPLPQRYRNGSACVPRMGHGLFLAAARHVRGGALDANRDRRLVLARDRMGIKPLYIARRGDDLYFGSELKAILVHPEIERWLSLDGLDCYLSLNYVPAPWTWWRASRSCFRATGWNGGAARSERNATGSLPRAARKNAGRRTRPKRSWIACCKQSVREHLLSDVPLGVWLSGGLDSSTLLHYAAEASSSRLKTFSISFHGRSFDESALHPRRWPSSYGTEHTELDLNPEQDLPGAIEEFAYYSDEPNADAGALPVWFLSQLTEASATVALSGEGADELFGGYLTYRASLLARTCAPLAAAGASGAAGDGAALAGVGRQDRLRIQAEALPGRLPDAGRARPRVLERNVRRSRKARAGSAALAAGARFASCANWPPAGDDLQAYLWFDQKYFLPDDILTKVDRISMAHSVEVRPPFLDHRIVEFASSLPASLKIHGSRQKVILRNLMRGKLAAGDPQPEEDRLRYSRARLVPRTAAAVARGSRGIRVRRTWRTSFRSRESKLMCEPISNGAPTSAIICGD